jgi:hypothetical protein
MKRVNEVNSGFAHKIKKIMDPDQTLKEIRTLCYRIARGDDQGDEWDAGSEELPETLAEKVQALDKWICKGGFLPKQWARTKV